MAVREIVRMGHPVLRRSAEPVGDPASAEIRALVGDMVDTLRDSGGVGLAAPQIAVSSRVVIFMVPPERADSEAVREAGGVPLTVLINPQIEVLDPTVVYRPEACLSIPEMAGVVPRPTRIRYRAVGLDGEPVEAEASGFHARVVLHEVDHLDGILYPMQMDDLSTFGFVSELRKAQEEQ